jgi:hypothetical protein
VLLDVLVLVIYLVILINAGLGLRNGYLKGKKFHVMGTSAICWVIWKARNKARFDKKIIINPMEIICHAGALMKF